MSKDSGSPSFGIERAWIAATDLRAVILSVLFATALFVVDLMTPRSTTETMLYVVVVFLSSRLPRPRDTWLAAAVCSCLILLAGLVSPPVDLSVVAKRGIALLTLWLTAMMSVRGQRAEETFKLAVESSADPMIMVDLDGRIVLTNSQVEKLFGYSESELLGERVEKLVPARFRDRHPEHRADFLAQPRARSMGAGRDLYALRKDGSEVAVEIGLNPIKTARGLFVLSTIVDITGRKLTEEDIAGHNRELQALLYVISHDLREPLRAVENFALLVHDRYRERLDEKGQDFLRRVVNAAARMRLLLDDILALSRARELGEAADEVEGGLIVKEALGRLATKTEEMGAHIDVAPELPFLRVNKTWAVEAIYNLVSNALKFTRPGEAPEIEVAAYRSPPGDASGQGFIVRDRGPGVSPEHAGRIFELFQRAVGREVEGNGAGLAIVRTVAERHGGRAWVRSREGGGSEFIITFGECLSQKGEYQYARGNTAGRNLAGRG